MSAAARHRRWNVLQHDQLISRHQEVHAVQESEESGCAILPGIAAYLEAEVVSRLEAGDHWLVYAKVNAGQVLLS